MGTAIWTESWAFETCPVAFCYWSALTSSSLALELFFLCSPWFSDNISLCFSLFSSQSGDKPLIKGPGKRDTFHSLPGVRSSLLGPWHVPGVGWPGFQLADTLKKIFLEPMLFTSFTCQHPEYNSRNSDLTDDWNPDPSSTDKESGIQHLISRIHNLEFRIQDCFVNFSLV